MKKRLLHIILAACAVLATMVLFITYGTVLPSSPLAPIQLDKPTAVDSNGKFTAVVDTESHRALILNDALDMTGVVSCSTADSPFDAITNVCVSNGLVYISGLRFEPDSDVIAKERIAVYDKGGNLQYVIFEMDGDGVSPALVALCDVPDGVALAYEQRSSKNSDTPTSKIAFYLINKQGIYEIGEVETELVSVFDAALADDGRGGYDYTILSTRGVLSDGKSNFPSEVLDGHVYTAIDIGSSETLYACDDETGALCAMSQGSPDVKELVAGTGYQSVHENGGVISLCNSETNTVTLCDTSGTVTSEFAEVRPSIGFSARMLLVWASGLYLVVLALVLAIRKLRRLIKEGKTESIGPMLTAVAVVTAIAVAVGSLSFASYKKMYDQRSNEINMCADYLEISADSLSEKMEKINNRNGLHGTNEELGEIASDLLTTAAPALSLVYSANENDIGLYCSLYGKDDKGIFYFFGTTGEYVMGTSAHGASDNGLQAAFEGPYSEGGDLLRGKTLRDSTLYRLVQIPTTDGKGVAGVIEIGSKVRSFESSITGDLAQRVLALLVLMIVVYLAYSELRACGRCLFSFRQRQQEDSLETIALLTRPFTLAITMLSSIDSVMTVLIARDLLDAAGMGSSSPLVALPAVMLGIGMVIGQGLYSVLGSRVGLRKLMARGALTLLLFACFTGLAVALGGFWLYCAAKLALSVPFGMLYSLGYSLPRLATRDETRSIAAGGVKRTDTSAAALGTILGGYAAQVLGNEWVYALVAVACVPVVLMALNLLPRGLAPLEELAQPDRKDGRILDFVKTPTALALALLVVFPATVAAGYSSIIFPLFSSDLGLTKSNINNICVLGQLVVFICIGRIDNVEAHYGKWRATVAAIALLGAVFLLFSVNATLVWSIAVIAIVGLLCKTSDGWKAMWLSAASEADVPTGRATGAMFATRSLALVAQPFIMSALVGAAYSFSVIVIGAICLLCAALFFLTTRKSSALKPYRK